MLIVYRKGDIRNQIVAWGADRERRQEGMCPCSLTTTPTRLILHYKELEAILLVTGALDIPEVSRPAERRPDDDEDSAEEEDYDPSSRMRSATTATNGRSKRNIRGPEKKKGNDSDSDFDFDL